MSIPPAIVHNWAASVAFYIGFDTIESAVLKTLKEARRPMNHAEDVNPVIAEKVRNLPTSYLTRDLTRVGEGMLVTSKPERIDSLEAALREALIPERTPRTLRRPPETNTLANLERRVTKLEATTPKYKAVWEPGRSYKPTDTVTYKGALWIVRSEKPTKACPGRGPDWRLMTKTR